LTSTSIGYRVFAMILFFSSIYIKDGVIQ